ncbi:MAG: hypothetical protein KIT86_02105 [Hydrogenophaga sp.]|nr:hypothetical protein [Hydrogenophaga sp.]
MQPPLTLWWVLVVKFTAQGEVRLRVDTHEREPGALALRFEVEDTGIGLTAEEMDQLFQPFLQADQRTTRAFGGSGLGLVISRRLCRLMGGDVEVASTPGQGSCFTAWLPQPVRTLEPGA